GALHPRDRTRGARLRVRDLLGLHQLLHRSPALQPGEAGLLRVRDRADAAARRRRPVPGQVLHHGDAVHRLRHRDHLPLPVGPGVRLHGALRADRDGALHRHCLRRLRVRVAAGRPGLGL
ncbi:MAG: NADH ubiquinone oxidoreductase chain A, partial [uncultured Nocardioidaceae bacterium]